MLGPDEGKTFCAFHLMGRSPLIWLSACDMLVGPSISNLHVDPALLYLANASMDFTKHPNISHW